MTRVTEGAQGSGLNSKMPPRGNSQPQRAVPNSIWSKIRPAGSYVQRNIQRSSGAPLTQLPLCNSPLLPPAACNHRRRIRSGAQRRQFGPDRQQSLVLRRAASGRCPLPGVPIWAGDFNGQDIRRFPHWARRICGNDRIEAASECGPTTSDVGKRLALFRPPRPDELQESHRRLQEVCPRCIDPPFDRSNGSRLLFCLNKARAPEHGYNRKTADRSRDRGVDGRLLVRRRPELGCKRPQLFHGRL